METDKEIHWPYGRPRKWSAMLKGLVSVDLKFKIKYLPYNKYVTIQYFFGSLVIKLAFSGKIFMIHNYINYLIHCMIGI